MRMRMILTALVLLTLTVGAARADVRPLALGGDGNALQLVDQRATDLAYRVEVGELVAMDVTTPLGDFTRLLLPGFHASQVEGAPELPMLNRLIVLPLGAAAHVEITAVRSQRYRLADLGVTHQLFPVQPGLSKSQDPSQVPFFMDTAAYDRDVVGRELVQVVEQGVLRGLRFGRLEVAPVTYFPRTGEIEVVESLEFRVRFDGADLVAQQELLARTHSPFFAPVYARLEGSRGFHDDYPDRVGDVVTMVIVTPDMFVAQLQPFVQWKTERGFHVIVGVIGSPEVGTTTTSIQAYIHGLYNNATPELPAPSFVIFVGDVAQCPTFSMSGDASDRPYCAVDGDLVPDIYYGRFSATNPSQLQAILDKTLVYDQFTMPDPSYLEEVVLIAGVDGTFAPTHGNGQINYGTEHYFNAAHGILSHTYLYPASSGPVEAEIVGHVSDGVSLINYTAHGSVTSWSDPSFTQANVNSLTNYGKYCLAIGNCCLTSTYDSGECFAETWLRAPNKGAIGYIGGSNSTYWDEDYWWGVGYHPSSQIDGDAWPYEATGLGAYDGLFHDHGEGDHLWYVTNDAIIFAGNLAVHESGSSRIAYYWNIYNLMGDPSISTYLGVPAANPVNHPTTVFVGQEEITVGAEYGSYVGLTQNGALVGAGTVGETGDVTIAYSQLLAPGVPLHLVVMAQNHEPYVTDINVIVPATVLIAPATIDANVTTTITVTVLDADGVLPQPGIDVWAEGLEYSTTPVVTNASGVAVVTVNYPYGPTLDIVGQDPGESYRLFTEPVAVNALSLTAPDLTVTTDIGLADAFALNLPGTLHAAAGQGGCTLYAELPDGSLFSTTSPSLTLTPDQLGVVTGIIALSGYDLYSEDFEIIEAYGTLSGTVATGGTPLAGVTVTGYDAAQDEAFSVVSNASGAWTVPDELLVADYTVVVDHFGYLHFETPFFVNYGANTLDIDLAPAPSGVLSGRLTDSVSGEGLLGTVRVYRTDDSSLFTEATSNAEGYYTTIPLPYFDYSVRARASHHVPVTIALTVDAPAITKNFSLEPTNGDLLVIDDGGGKLTAVPAKLDPKTGAISEPAYIAPGDKSADQIRLDLEELGYYVTVESAGSVDPASFWNYDLVILACGDNISTLQNSALKAGLVAFAQDQGHILLEGGELGYDQYGSGDFATHVMHSADWNHDSSGNLTIDATDHYVVNSPNVLSGQIAITYSGYGDSDAMVPLPDAVKVASWTSYPSDASIICYDTNPAPEGGQIVFFCFNYDAAGAQRNLLLENAVQWLLTPEFGDCSVSGTVHLSGQSDHSGVHLRLTPGDFELVTGPDGTYSFAGLFAGDYHLVVTRDEWSSGAADVALAPGESVSGLDFTLYPIVTRTWCDAPAVPIPDNNPTGVTCVLDVPVAETVAQIGVYVDITHTFSGDLTIDLTSPAGTTVRLKNYGQGGPTPNWVGWYPDDMSPFESLDAFVGELMQGQWSLHVFDTGPYDTGTLNEWCLRFTYAQTATGVGDDDLPRALSLDGNYPNPFNPMTSIEFGLPRDGRVDLVVFDVAGRRVRTLVAEERTAGRHVVVWNGRDDADRAAPSGTYFYRLRVGTENLTSKMLLLK